MKLKKIVSLALAGILAVSMLTACGDSADKKDPASSEPTTPATGIVSLVDTAIKDYNSDLEVTVKSSVTLNDAMDDLFEKSYNELKANNYKVIQDKLDAMFGKKVNGDMTWLNTKLNPSATAAQAGTMYYWNFVEVEKVSGVAAQVKAANQIAEMFDGIKGTFADSNNKVWNASFTLYVSDMTAVKVGDTEVPVVVIVLEAKTEAKL